MRRLLFFSSLLCLLTLMACHRQKNTDKATAAPQQQPKVINHSGPDQARIDSIKAAKTKAKKAKAKN